jgi:ribosomal protein L44E
MTKSSQNKAKENRREDSAAGRKRKLKGKEEKDTNRQHTKLRCKESKTEMDRTQKRSHNK